MKLNQAQISRTLSQFSAQVLAEDHPAVAKFCEMFGHHTFFLDARGLHVLELLEVPGVEAQDGEVIRLAEWSDAHFTKLKKRSMEHFAGLDVSVKETSVCILDDAGKIVKEVKVASEPRALLKVLGNPAYCFKRIGLEAGPLSQWLFSALAEAELPVICVETRHMQAVLKAQINKTDRNDARGIAQMMRVGLYRPVHVKTLRS